MLATLRVPALVLFSSLAVAGCAGSDLFGGGSDVTTASVAQVQPVVDPACQSLGNQIDALRKEGVADKIERAAAKKYKMTAADITKADQLTKVNAEFQAKCSTIPRPAVTAAAPAATPPAASTAAKTAKAATTAATATRPAAAGAARPAVPAAGAGATTAE